MFPRFAHELKANRKTETPEHFLFLDTETLPRRIDDDTIEQVFRLGAAIYWHRARSRRVERVSPIIFYNADDLWVHVDHLSRAHSRLTILAHNTGFDLQALGGPKALAIHGWIITKAIVDDPPFILKARKGTSSLLLLDWYNYFRGSLAAAGSLLGVPKLPMPDFTKSDSEWLAYCRNDVQVLYRAVREYVEWIETNDLGNFAHTLAGQALNAYRHRFMPGPIYVHDRRSAIGLERRAYFGGRVELYKRSHLPTKTYTYVDINSAYASVMHAKTYPYALRRVIANPKIEKVKEWLKTHAVIADVELETPVPLYPCRMDGRLVFPVGSFTTTLATPELGLAMTRSHVRRVTLCAIYSRANLFRSWVEQTYEMRSSAKRRGNHFQDEMLKRLSNSLFGKFGQRNYEWTRVGEERGREDEIWKELHISTGTVVTFRRLGGIKEKRTKMTEGFNSFVGIAAHVTSEARMLLLSYIEQAGWAHTFYCDTDSLIVDEEGAASLAPSISPSELGKLKIEGIADDVELLAPKNYRFGEHTRHKGRKNNAVALPDGRYEQEQFISLTGAMRMGWQGGPLVRTVRKRDALTYHKGTVEDDNTITPLRLYGGYPSSQETRTSHATVTRRVTRFAPRTRDGQCRFALFACLHENV